MAYRLQIFPRLVLPWAAFRRSMDNKTSNHACVEAARRAAIKKCIYAHVLCHRFPSTPAQLLDGEHFGSQRLVGPGKSDGSPALPRPLQLVRTLARLRSAREEVCHAYLYKEYSFRPAAGFGCFVGS